MNLQDYLERYASSHSIFEHLEMILHRPPYRDLLTLCHADSQALALLHQAVREAVLDQPFDEQLKAVTELNDFFEALKPAFWTSARERFCQIDKIFSPIDTKVRLLKRLQGGSEPVRADQHHRAELAEEFGISLNALNDYLDELRDGTSILGSRVKIDLRRGQNNYDSTIHPVFLALNLSEVHFLTVILKGLTKDSRLQKTAGELIADIYRQLSPYAWRKIDANAEREGITLFENNLESYEQPYRREERDDPEYLFKAGSPCELTLKSDMGRPIRGRMVMKGADTFLQAEDGTLYDVSFGNEDVYSLKPAEEGSEVSC